LKSVADGDIRKMNGDIFGDAVYHNIIIRVQIKSRC